MACSMDDSPVRLLFRFMFDKDYLVQAGDYAKFVCNIDKPNGLLHHTIEYMNQGIFTKHYGISIPFEWRHWSKFHSTSNTVDGDFRNAVFDQSLPYSEQIDYPVDPSGRSYWFTRCSVPAPPIYTNLRLFDKLLPKLIPVEGPGLFQ